MPKARPVGISPPTPMPAGPEEGFLALAEMLTIRSRAKIIVLSGQSERSNALKAVNEGAYDFLVKPPEIDELKVVVKRASEMAHMEREISEMRQKMLASAEKLARIQLQ